MSQLQSHVLTYRGCPLDRNPRGLLLREVARYVLDGRAVRLRLEPGDVTLYHVQIVPCSGLTAEPTVGRGYRWIWLHYLSTSRVGRGSFLVPLSGQVGSWDFPDLGEWEKDLFAWWVNELAFEVVEASKDGWVSGNSEMREKHLCVLMKNDYPEAVYENPKDAEKLEGETKDESQRSIYRHTHVVPFYRAQS